MGDANDNGSKKMAAQYIMFACLLFIGLVPLIVMIWKSPRVRNWLSRSPCTGCCVGLLPTRVHYDESDLRVLQELEEGERGRNVGVNGAYRLYQSRQARRMPLRLNSWREDIRANPAVVDPMNFKLQRIQGEAKKYGERAASSIQPRCESGSVCAVPFSIEPVEVNSERQAPSELGHR
ncbi:TPA: hypothetical protein N0F65_010098 [Lagenidium giganteum]|uniref:Uncharacterized protein n=1 Tax=Lagenidium giganteum TaxID=4803 RepID=A0AAV2YC93_9STRA|nr:TPA: hypothetical protein N0F65_009636 [Lagenidium giganteum]DAZ93082.1 TPA: hypothetical protein N0F65_010098 [Lagenidium giganteum]